MPWNNSDVCEVQQLKKQQVRWCHCRVNHQAFWRNCTTFKRETEFVQIRIEQRIPRLQSIRKLLRINPNPKLIFSNEVKKTSNVTTSKSVTRSEQEIQSDSRTNVTQTFFENFGNEEENSPAVPSYATDTILREKEKEKEPALPTANCKLRKSVKCKKIKDQQM